MCAGENVYNSRKQTNKTETPTVAFSFHKMVVGKCHYAVLTMTKVGALWELYYHKNWGIQKGPHGKSSLILCGFYQQRASPATTRLFIVDCIYVENACKWSKSPIFIKSAPTSCWVILGLWNNYPHTYMHIKDKISLLKLEVLKEDFYHLL